MSFRESHKRFISIRVQLLLIMVGVIVALQVSSTWLQYVAQKEYMQNELKDRASYIRDGLTDKANVLLNNIARETEESIAAFDFFGITQTLQQIVRPEAELQLDYAILMDASRMVYVHTKQPDLQNTILNDEESLFAVGVTKTRVREYKHDGVAIMEFIKPLQISTEPWGVLRLGVSLSQLEKEIAVSKEDINKKLNDIILRFIIHGLALVIIGAGLIMLVANKLTRPIIALTESAKELAEGNYDVDVAIADRNLQNEVDVLAESFRSMIQSIRQSRVELKNFNQTLEQKVIARTRELELKEDALLIAKEEAEQANRAKSSFLANMSHEIRTPMNAVLGYAEIMLGNPEFPRQFHQPVNAISRAGYHLLDVINEILDISKIEAGAITLNTQDFDLRDLILGLSEMFEVRCRQQGLEWKVEDDLVEVATVHADQGKIRQILINFLGNAVKFTDQGEVKLVVEQKSQRYCFVILDTGQGIPASQLEEIYRPFQQSSEGFNKGGTGLGLSIAKSYIDLMGGELITESSLGKGSRFSFTLELPPAEGVVPQRQRRVYHNVHLPPQLRVSALVVDDVEDNRIVLLDILKNAGIHVVTASNGREALDAIEQQPLDIVFMDIRMPVMDGMEAISRIRQGAKRELPCVAVSASTLHREEDSCLAAGFDLFIAKPFRAEQIYHCIESLLNIRFVVLQARDNMPSAPQVSDFKDVVLPQIIYARLKEAAELNALIRIETLVTEIRSLGGNAAVYGEYIAMLTQSYDMDGILASLQEVSHE
jgi:signal transduction histidine kinase/DNA-binding NarL/FixJ family response regulator